MMYRPIVALLACCVLTTGTPSIAGPSQTAAIFSVEVQRPNLVVHGSYLAKVEINGFPTGTGITTPAVLGEATRQGPAGPNEIWIWPIPRRDDDMGSWTSIYAQGIDSQGHGAGTKELPFTGASDIDDALHGRTPPERRPNLFDQAAAVCAKQGKRAHIYNMHPDPKDKHAMLYDFRCLPDPTPKAQGQTATMPPQPN